MLVYWLFRLTIVLMRPLPLRLGYKIAAAVAEVNYHFFGRQRRNLNENLGWVLQSDDEREVDRVARRAFRNFGKFGIDFIHFPVLTREEVHKRLVFRQWRDLDEVIASGRGGIMVTMHMGVFDLGAASLAAYGYPISAVAESYRYEPMNELIRRSREELGMGVIPRGQLVRGIFRSLRSGQFLAMLMDVPAPGESVTVDFLGGPAEVSSVPARVALRTGAWVVPSIVLRGPEDDTLIRPLVDIRSIRYEATGDEERDVLALTQRIMQWFEARVREHPEQWYIFRRVWPSLPRTAGEAAVAEAGRIHGGAR